MYWPHFYLGVATFTNFLLLNNFTWNSTKLGKIISFKVSRDIDIVMTEHYKNDFLIFFSNVSWMVLKDKTYSYFFHIIDKQKFYFSFSIVKSTDWHHFKKLILLSEIYCVRLAYDNFVSAPLTLEKIPKNYSNLKSVTFVSKNINHHKNSFKKFAKEITYFSLKFLRIERKKFYVFTAQSCSKYQ